MRRSRLEVQEQDDSVISDAALASKMLRGAGLPYASRAQVLYNASGKYVAERIESCLRNMFGRYHESERKLGRTVKPGFRKPRDQRRRFQHPGSRDGGQSFGSLHPSRKRRTFFQEDANDECEAEEEYDDNEDDGSAEHFDENSGYMGQEADSAEYLRECLENVDYQREELDEEEESNVIPQAYTVGWQAKQMAAGVQSKRGFVAVVVAPPSDGAAPSLGGPDVGRRTSETKGASKSNSHNPDV